MAPCLPVEQCLASAINLQTANEHAGHGSSAEHTMACNMPLPSMGRPSLKKSRNRSSSVVWPRSNSPQAACTNGASVGAGHSVHVGACMQTAEQLWTCLTGWRPGIPQATARLSRTCGVFQREEFLHAQVEEARHRREEGVPDNGILGWANQRLDTASCCLWHRGSHCLLKGAYHDVEQQDPVLDGAFSRPMCAPRPDFGRHPHIECVSRWAAQCSSDGAAGTHLTVLRKQGWHLLVVGCRSGSIATNLMLGLSGTPAIPFHPKGR